MEENESPFYAIFVAIGICAVTFCAGAFYQAVAKVLYSFASDMAPGFNIPPPHIQQALLPELIKEVLFSSGKTLQLVKVVENFVSLAVSNDPFRFAQLFTELISVFNLFLSWRYKTYAWSVVVLVSLLLAYFQAEILFVRYIMIIISAAFGNVFCLS